MPQALPLTTKLSNSSSKSTSFKTIKAQFGDGYSQRAADGINNKIDSWSISWENLSSADKDTVLTALDAVGGYDYLTWTPFGESSSKKFILKDGSYSVSHVEGGTYFTISTSLIQVFDV
jgi:phage-related protein